MTSFYVADAIDDVEVEVDLIRHNAATTVKGRVQARDPQTAVAIKGSFQPMTFQELQMLPEGMRSQGLCKFYTKTQIETVDQAASGIPDRIEYQGVSYQAKMIVDWNDVGGYYKVILDRIER